MPELRKDPISGRWVIISIERGKRPSDFGMRVSPKKGGFCAFCEGNEHTTPPEILAFRSDKGEPNTPGWTLRVVSNKFPALNVEGQLNRSGDGIFDKMNGVGAHEVIIECPDHNLTLSTMSLKSVEDVLWAFHHRITDLKKDSRFRYVLVFKNEGDEAGSSLEHTHSQLIALPIVPHLVEEELFQAKQYYEYKERCIFCDIIHQETADKKRVISENDDFIALAPFAPRSPFETMILPKRHESSYLPDGKFSLLAQLLQQTLKQIDKILDLPPYNMMIHTSPFKNEENEYYHWHMEIIPKLTKIAGFEWGSGFYINPTPPEEAAKFLREAEI
ncbi:MAG TPA: galactose-1-phosphate uridylyltransferase [Nitrospirae bacterium]|nr:galactose-1-phosphate uridylyltransferase [bacterium BMS3Abin06]HDH12328.1 galactose-1-phosphate uridylyltransferase [Nitrospirota bacterium]HDZ00381.1 galactose-1-phosphate uridylyltransferase [Nitrospirota bacterium]